MKSSIIKLACGALLLSITFTACTTAQAETAVTPTPTPAPTISPKVLKEQATVQEIRNSTVEVFTNGQRSATVIFLARGANEIESVTPRPIAYEELSAEQLKIFDDIIAPYPDKIKADEITPEAAEKEQLAKVDEYIQSRQLPSNAKELFTQHKERTNYADKIKKPESTPTPAPQETENNNNNGGGGGNDWGSGNNAPQPSGGSSGGNSGGGGDDYGYDPGSIGSTGGTSTTPSGIPGGADINEGGFSFIEGMGEW